MVDPSSLSDWAIVYNPKYGARVGPYGSKPIAPPKHKIEELYPFYEKLEESVLSEGFRDPIFCIAISQGTYCKYGTSRLWIAKTHDLYIPAIIADYVGAWPQLKSLSGEADIKDQFTTPPSIVEVRENYMRIDECLR